MAAPLSTRASRCLPSRLEAKGWTLAELERALEVTRGVAYRWPSGERRPDPHLRQAIQRLLGIPADWWMTDNEYRVAFGRERRAA